MTMTTREVLETAAAYIKEAIDQLPADQPEVPDVVYEWPENDEHLRGEFWRDSDWCSVISYRGDGWYWWDHAARCWHPDNHPEDPLPLTRTTDPSQPRRFDSLADIPEDVDRVAGKYQGYPCELARFPLSSTGWMMRINHSATLQRWFEYVDLHKDELTDLEEAINHE